MYIWRPEFASALVSVPFDLSCYHIDDEYSFSSIDLPLQESERRLISAADQVFIHSPGLIEKKGGFSRHVSFVPNGVDYPAYATPAEEPIDLAPIPRPRIGYTGYIKKQLDWSLILHLTLQHPDWSFVFVGPRHDHPEIADPLGELAGRHNVHFLGAKSVNQLASYPQHFDVCIMPYTVNAYTHNIYPLKLHEYLASGRPVVGSPIRSLHEFGRVIALPSSSEEWSAALAAALVPPVASHAATAARQDIARRYDWSEIIYRIAGTICNRLGQKYTRQLQRLDVDAIPSGRQIL